MTYPIVYALARNCVASPLNVRTESDSDADAELEAMIGRDHNRATVLIWSLANETPVSDARNRFLSRLAARARALDDSRLLSAAMEKHYRADAPDVAGGGELHRVAQEVAQHLANARGVAGVDAARLRRDLDLQLQPLCGCAGIPGSGK